MEMSTNTALMAADMPGDADGTGATAEQVLVHGGLHVSQGTTLPTGAVPLPAMGRGGQLLQPSAGHVPPMFGPPGGGLPLMATAFGTTTTAAPFEGDGRRAKSEPRVPSSPSSPHPGRSPGRAPRADSEMPPPPPPRAGQWAELPTQLAGFGQAAQAERYAAAAVQHAYELRDLAHRQRMALTQAPPQGTWRPHTTVKPFEKPPGTGEARHEIGLVVLGAVKVCHVAGFLVPSLEMAFETHLDSCFQGAAAAVWRRTERLAGNSALEPVGEDSRVWRRLQSMLQTYDVYDAKGEFQRLLKDFRWRSTPTETSAAMDDFVAMWQDLEVRTAHLPLPQRVPHCSPEWLWQILMHHARPPLWAQEVAKEHPEKFDAWPVFRVFEMFSHKAHGPTPMGGGRSGLHALAGDQASDVPELQGLLDEAARVAAHHGLTLKYHLQLPEASVSGAGGEDAGHLFAMRNAAGVLLARNGEPLQCHICKANHFASNCPHLHDRPCKRCGAADHTAASCPQRFGTRSSAPYERPGLGGGQQYVTGVNQLVSPSVAPTPVPSSAQSPLSVTSLRTPSVAPSPAPAYAVPPPSEDLMLRWTQEREARTHERAQLLSELSAAQNQAQDQARLLYEAHDQLRRLQAPSSYTAPPPAPSLPPEAHGSTHPQAHGAISTAAPVGVAWTHGPRAVAAEGEVAGNV